ncbi:hypothetical protein ACFLUW_00410 [Chloroflexota bacterium]
MDNKTEVGKKVRKVRRRKEGSLRQIGKRSIAIDAKTKKRLKVIAGSLPLSLWLRRDVDKHYTRYVFQVGNDFEILGFDEDEEPILGKPLTDKGKMSVKGEDVEDSQDNTPCDLTDIKNWKKDYD